MNAAVPFEDRPGWRSQIGPAGVMVLAAALRLAGLGSRPLWTDEGSTWTASTLPVTELLHRCVYRDASPPFFYFVTQAFLKIRDDEFHLRLYPALASIVLVWLTYRLARLALPRGAATLAALLCAISPFQLMYGQEARTYVPVAMFMVASTYVYARLLQKPGPQRWLPLVLLTAAGLWTQSIAALAAGAQGLYAVLTPTGRRRFWPWASAMAAAGLLYLPWFVYSHKMAEHLGQSHWYIPEASPHAVFNIVRGAALTPFPLAGAPRNSIDPGLAEFMPKALAYALLTIPPLLALALTLPLLRVRGPRGVLARLSWIAWLAPLLAVIAVSIVGQSLLIPRYFVFLGPWFMVLFALGIASLRAAPARVALVTALVAFSVMGLVRYARDWTKEPWREVTAHIRATAPPGRTTILVPFDVDPIAYYLRDGRSGLGYVEVRHPEQAFSATFTARQLDETEALARATSRDFDEVWTIVRSAGTDGRRELARRTEAVAAEGRELAEFRVWRSYNAPLYVRRFVRRAAAPADSAAVR